jgi:hypothetical protein
VTPLLAQDWWQFIGFLRNIHKHGFISWSIVPGDYTNEHCLQSTACLVSCNLVKTLGNTSVQESLSLLFTALLLIQYPLGAIATESRSADPYEIVPKALTRQYRGCELKAS